ncbi:ubiquitin conjugation factor E4 A isoform X2 [Sitophilus oryzae]|uniref:Ubiquitin conjugation factor E4 A n=1 Tax=Sitophilus oryzae TaxID=7048 RepID=A0A6J2XJ40_SITOR|nr:ubiquitin conjugation factor E4 A isoform X2 [Sitophilus oryzae]
MDRQLSRRMSGANPFAALFHTASQDHLEPPEPSLNDQLEEIFSFTLNERATLTKEILFLEDVFKDLDTTVLDMDNLDQALFERLFMCQKDNLTIIQQRRLSFRNPHAIEIEPIKYLYKAYVKVHENQFLKAEDRLEVRDKIIQNVATSIIQPDIYVDQDMEQQMIDVLKEGGAHYDTFFVEAARRTLDEENNDDIILTSFIDQMNRKMTEELNKCSLVNLDYNVFNYFNVFTSNDYLAEIFMDCCVPNKLHVGSEYANTAIGALFNLSVLPKSPNGSYDFFTNPMDQPGNSRTETFLWSSLDKLNEHIHNFLLVLLKCNNAVRNKVLNWLGGCLKYNVDRGKLWNSQAPPELNPANYTTVSDGFMINFCSILLRLCRPFCSNFKEKKILKVDPTYPAVPNNKADSKGVHMYDLSSETCFIPVESSEDLEELRETAEKYNFITESFFMAHKALDLGYRVAVDRMMKMSHEMGRLERAYRDAVQQSGHGSDVATSMHDRLISQLTKFFSLKCVLSEPKLLKDLFDFASSTSYWAVQVAIKTNFNSADKSSFAPLEEVPVTFPLPDKIPNTLKCVPEFLTENIVSYLVFLKRFNPRTFEEVGYEKMEPLLTFVLVFMGSRQHLKNPHIRARLAEGLESLLPYDKEEPIHDLGGYQRELIFIQHPHKLEIVKNLMSVFVGIEMTGQSVEFEQKFKYRRPMYTIFEYLWEISEHSECFKILAEEAEANMEAVNPPLFLRFANLLINDAIFLLDEALANMAKLKEMQTAHENGEWESLSPPERAQNMSYMHHIGNLARFDNILGKDTTTTLEKLTSKITIVFTHQTMVDRIAAMLNYFLLNLVGPNKKNFKVKDSKEYSFDPAGTVLDICKIYVNLKDSDAFCLAVSQDGRSYSPNLFSLAEDVLVRIGGGTLIGELKEVAQKVAEKAIEHKANEEAISEAPDHFLDPIMSTLMTDPVILPSSRQTVDRTTIARHLLSDQTDPFNRSPLSMDQIVPNQELREEISKWVEERKARK